MAPLAVADEAESLAAITSKLEGRKAELAVWDEQQNPALPISQAWTEFLASPNRPDSGPETLCQYDCQWSRFADWMKEKHPDKLTSRDVTKEIAEESGFCRAAGTGQCGKLTPDGISGESEAGCLERIHALPITMQAITKTNTSRNRCCRRMARSSAT